MAESVAAKGIIYRILGLGNSTMGLLEGNAFAALEEFKNFPVIWIIHLQGVPSTFIKLENCKNANLGASKRPNRMYA